MVHLCGKGVNVALQLVELDQELALLVAVELEDLDHLVIECTLPRCNEVLRRKPDAVTLSMYHTAVPARSELQLDLNGTDHQLRPGEYQRIEQALHALQRERQAEQHSIWGAA